MKRSAALIIKKRLSHNSHVALTNVIRRAFSKWKETLRPVPTPENEAILTKYFSEAFPQFAPIFSDDEGVYKERVLNAAMFVNLTKASIIYNEYRTGSRIEANTVARYPVSITVITEHIPELNRSIQEADKIHFEERSKIQAMIWIAKFIIGEAAPFIAVNVRQSTDFQSRTYEKILCLAPFLKKYVSNVDRYGMEQAERYLFEEYPEVGKKTITYWRRNLENFIRETAIPQLTVHGQPLHSVEETLTYFNEQIATRLFQLDCQGESDDDK